MLPIKKILLLDDDLEIHQYVFEILQTIQEQSCELVSYHDYDEALVDVDKKHFDLCLVDYIFNDPYGRNGIDFIDEALIQNPYLPCILFTGSGSQVTELQGIQVGAVDYIDKGNIRPQIFIRAVRYALKRANTIKELYSLYQQTLITSQFRSEMMRLAAHDIKNPLSTILLSLDILKRQDDLKASPTFVKHIDRIESAVSRIQAITDDIMSLEDLHVEDDFEPTDITLLIQSVIRELVLQDQLQTKELVYTPDPNLPEVIAVPGQIREVVHNLVSNAIKYTPLNGKIEIQTIANGNMVKVAVIDDGYGIVASEQDKVFQPFYRAVTEETKHINGTGLGLYLVKQIVERHQGTISFESVHGQGSTFRFLLPCV